MDLFLQLFGKITSFLPNSFILTQLVAYNEELQPFYHAISVANWFLPFNILVSIFSGWAVAMLTATLGFHFWKKL